MAPLESTVLDFREEPERDDEELLLRAAGVLATINALEQLCRKPAPVENPETVRKRQQREEAKQKLLRLSARLCERP